MGLFVAVGLSSSSSVVLLYADGLSPNSVPTVTHTYSFGRQTVTGLQAWRLPVLPSTGRSPGILVCLASQLEAASLRRLPLRGKGRRRARCLRQPAGRT